MRTITASVLAEVLLASFFPESVVVFFMGLAIAVLAFILLKRESLIILPLLVAMPVISQALTEFPHRLGVLLALAAFVLLALSDLASRHRGAPIRFTRLLFWYLSGAYVLLVAFFTAVDEGVLQSSILLVLLVVIGALGAYSARFMARRQRGAEQHPMPPTVDALATGFLFLEIVVALTFLPLNPISLGAFSVIALWLLIRLVVAVRANKLTFDKVLRLSGIAGIVSIAVAFPLLLF